jgi:imidazolonepropionase-like amidohydrolase
MRQYSRAVPGLLVVAACAGGVGAPADVGPPDEGSRDGTDPPVLAVVGANVIHDPGLEPLEDATILVRGGEVVALGPRSAVAVPEGSRIVAGEGLWVVPGLWDMHVHLTNATELAMPVLLANGVTGVRDMGGDPERVAEMERRRREGELPGPRVVMAGPYVDGPKPGLPHRITVETAEEGRAAADSVRALGGAFIKIHNGVPPAAFFALLERAAEIGFPVVGHVPVEVDPVVAVRAGQAGLEHFVTPFEGTLRPLVSGPDGLAPYIADGLDTLVHAIAAARAALTPTVHAYLVRARRWDLARDPDPRLRYVAHSLQEQWDHWYPVQDRDGDPTIEALRTEFYRQGLEVIRRFHEAGVPILAGTDLAARDVLPGFHLHDEIRSLMDAGLTPREALAAATTAPARFLGADSLGAIAVGHRADLVLLAGDPLADMDAIRQIRGVVADGRYYDRRALDALLDSTAQRAEDL